MERRVRAERGPSARERCGNDWHSPPVFMGRVNQMPIFRDVPEEASNRYGKLLTRLTGSRKARKLAIIQAFCASRDSGNDGQRRGAEAKTCSRAAPALRLSLPHRHLVNSVDGACWSDGRVGNDGILARGAAGGGRGVGVECAAGEATAVRTEEAQREPESKSGICLFASRPLSTISTERRPLAKRASRRAGYTTVPNLNRSDTVLRREPG
jgi:hypothetical protein